MWSGVGPAGIRDPGPPAPQAEAIKPVLHKYMTRCNMYSGMMHLTDTHS